MPVTTDPERVDDHVRRAGHHDDVAASTTTVFAFGFDQALVSKVWGDYLAADRTRRVGLLRARSDDSGLESLT